MPVNQRSSPLGIQELRKRLFAWFLERSGECIDRRVGEYKRRLLSTLQGAVLEIGPGTGGNFKYYPHGITWTGVEPNPYMNPYLFARAKKYGFDVELRVGRGEDLGFDDATFDAVVSTHVLCSVLDPERVVREIYRVLKPGGIFVYLEHTAASRGSTLRFLQRAIAPIWRIAADGCHTDRETGALLARSGFSTVDEGQFRLKSACVCPVSPHIYGTARK